MKRPYFSTKLGKLYLGDSKKILSKDLGSSLNNKVQLILTSPPFPLNKKKKYGNLNGKEYKKWFIQLAEIFSTIISENGSIVIELGNSWEARRPIQSLLHLESLIGFVRNKKAKLRLCQQFVCYNPSRLPSPTQWVSIERIRTIDSFTHVWWLAKSDYPKADNSKVLRPYSDSMKSLLKSKKYNDGVRPSEHRIGKKSFLKNNKGSIMHNVIEIEQIDNSRAVRLPQNIFSIANTVSNDFFLNECRRKNITPHPARMPFELASFFIEFLTDPGDLVLDPFAGSNTTGFCAEKLGRKWIATEANEDYVEQSKIRFSDPILKGKKKECANGINERNKRTGNG